MVNQTKYRSTTVGRKSLAKERREQIIRALNRCIAKYGLQNTSIKKIAQEAGVQPGILHHYFKDRDEIIEELVNKIVDELTAEYLAEIGNHVDPETRFAKAVEFMFGPQMINTEYAGFFYDCWAEAKRNERIRDSFRMLYSRFRKAIVDLLLESGKSAGLSRAEIEELATMVIAIQDGVSLQWEMAPRQVPLPQMTRLTKRLIELYVEDKTRKRSKNPARRKARRA
ncbi:MAG: TetR/AcrR family transcriptional regulator [Candidatus Abyssubacteria bacterium]